jgi:hypothetical protein
MNATYTTPVSHLECIGKGDYRTRSFLATPEAFDRYFRGEGVACACGANWFDVLCENAREWPQRWTVTEIMGGLSTVKDLDLAAGTTITLSLDEIGVPRGAEIFDVNIMLDGTRAEGLPYVPALMVGNNIHFDPFPRPLTLHGVPAKGTGTMIARVGIRYVPPGDDEVPRSHLCEAARHFVGERFNGIVIPANIAVEASLGRALTEWLEGIRSVKDVDAFLSDGATYSHQLKVMAPLAARDLRVNELPGAIRNGLDDLRKYRNDIAHRGHPYRESRPPLDKDSAARLLVSALFGYHYTRHLREAVAARATSAQ